MMIMIRKIKPSLVKLILIHINFTYIASISFFAFDIINNNSHTIFD